MLFRAALSWSEACRRSPVESVQLAVGPAEQGIVPEEQADEREAAADQSDGKRRERPVQLEQFLLVLRRQLAAVAVGSRGEARQLAFERGDDRAQLQDDARLVDRGDERLGPRQGVRESLDGALVLRVGIGEGAKVPILEQLQPVEKDLEPQLDLIGVD